MCTQCLIDISKSTGSMAGTTGLVGASIGMLGFKRLSFWLAARESQLASSRWMKVGGLFAVWAGFGVFYAVGL